MMMTMLIIIIIILIIINTRKALNRHIPWSSSPQTSCQTTHLSRLHFYFSFFHYHLPFLSSYRNQVINWVLNIHGLCGRPHNTEHVFLNSIYRIQSTVESDSQTKEGTVPSVLRTDRLREEVGVMSNGVVFASYLKADLEQSFQESEKDQLEEKLSV